MSLLLKSRAKILSESSGLTANNAPDSSAILLGKEETVEKLAPPLLDLISLKSPLTVVIANTIDASLLLKCTS